MRAYEILELPIKSWKQDPTTLIEAIKKEPTNPVVVRCILGPGVIDKIKKETGKDVAYLPMSYHIKSWRSTDLDFLHQYVRQSMMQILKSEKVEEDRNLEICLQLLAGHYRDHALYSVFTFDLYCLYRRLSGAKT